MTYLQQHFDTIDYKKRVFLRRELFYPDYPTTQERDDAQVGLIDSLPEVSQRILEEFQLRFDSTEKLSLQDFRVFLSDIGYSKPEVIVYPQVSGISQYFSKHFGGITLAHRLRCQIERNCL